MLREWEWIGTDAEATRRNYGRGHGRGQSRLQNWDREGVLGRSGGWESSVVEDRVAPVVAAGDTDEGILPWSAQSGISWNGASKMIRDLDANLEPI